MTKRVVLVTALLITALLPVNTAFACSVNCAGGSCSGTGSCKCDANDKPVCIDQVEISEAALIAQADYARSFNTPGLDRYADAAEKMAQAIADSDQDAYFLGLLQRDEALNSLTARDRARLNSYDPSNPDHRGTPQK